MATKIRLARHGKKNYAFYHIVVADSRSPRDGRFIEKLGTYNPNTNPATIELNFERSLYWVGVGAQPTDTTRTILSKEGVMMMHHLNGGVKKGALTAEQAQAKFEQWTSEKTAKAESAKAAMASASAKSKSERMAAETKAKEAKAAIVAAKLAEAAAAAAAASAEEAAASEEVAEEAAE
ncbi:MAG: 30S ribosomal protein S16 [Rikenellaceae bacterium]